MVICHILADNEMIIKE